MSFRIKKSTKKFREQTDKKNQPVYVDASDLKQNDLALYKDNLGLSDDQVDDQPLIEQPPPIVKRSGFGVRYCKNCEDDFF